MLSSRHTINHTPDVVARLGHEQCVVPRACSRSHAAGALTLCAHTLCAPAARRNLQINLDEGGMPWTCLPGEPANVNWCNGAGGADLYKNPPAAWRGARYQGRAPPLRCQLPSRL